MFMLNVKAIIVSKMTSHCAGTVQMREELQMGVTRVCQAVLLTRTLEQGPGPTLCRVGH